MGDTIKKDAELEKSSSAHAQKFATCTYRNTYDADRCATTGTDYIFQYVLYKTYLHVKTPPITPGTDYIFESIGYETYLYVKAPQMMLETVTAATHSSMSYITMLLGR